MENPNHKWRFRSLGRPSISIRAITMAILDPPRRSLADLGDVTNLSGGNSQQRDAASAVSIFVSWDTVDKWLICGWKFEPLLIIMAIISVRL